MGIMKRVRNTGINGTTSPSHAMRRFLAGRLGVVEDMRDGHYEEGEE